NYVDRQLAKNEAYRGSIGDVDVHLWRGAYVIRDIKINKVEGDVPVPLFAARKIDLSLEWKELLHGAVVGEVVLNSPEVNIVAGPTTEESQTGKGGDWVKTLESLFPLKINRLEVQQGKVHFQNFHSTPPVDIYTTEIEAVATNLTNKRDLAQP